MSMSIRTVAILLLAAPTASADFYAWDFLTGDFDNKSLTPFGDGAVNLARPTDKGLRLQLPLGEKTAGIGFATRFQLRGDFEITMRYRIDRIEKPQHGWGAGPSLYLTTVTDNQPATSLSRMSRKDDREIYSIFRALPQAVRHGSEARETPHCPSRFEYDVVCGRWIFRRICSPA
jgi:hypothetical protein